MADIPFVKGMERRQPWWASALLAGFGGVLAILLALGLLGSPVKGSEARSEQPKPSEASIAAAKSDNDRLNRIESKVDEALRMLDQQGQRISHIEGRMDRGK